jgi:hypothetical protein
MGYWERVESVGGSEVIGGVASIGEIDGCIV